MRGLDPRIHADERCHKSQAKRPTGAFKCNLFTIRRSGKSGSPPLARYEAGETVFAEGTKTGRLLILKSELG